MKTELPIACNLDALTEAQQARRTELAARLQSSIRAIVPTPQGYTFRLPADDRTLLEVIEFISLERQCCPFLNFEISLKEGEDFVVVNLSGRDSVKEFLAAEFGF